jgi:hypothetical protein
VAPNGPTSAAAASARGRKSVRQVGYRLEACEHQEGVQHTDAGDTSEDPDRQISTRVSSFAGDDGRLLKPHAGEERDEHCTADFIEASISM